MSVTELSPGELLLAVKVASSSSSESVLRLGEEQSSFLASRPASFEDAESCRLIALGAAGAEQYAKAQVWRTRSYARCLELDWHAGAAVVMISDLFRVLEMANDRYPHGQTLDVMISAPEGELLLDELERFTTCAPIAQGFGPDGDLIARFCADKRGYLSLLDKDWAAAERWYSHAGTLLTPKDERGRIKVDLGLALVRYMRDVAEGGDGSLHARETAAIAESGAIKVHKDLYDAAGTNAARMSEARRDLVTYEVL